MFRFRSQFNEVIELTKEWIWYQWYQQFGYAFSDQWSLLSLLKVKKWNLWMLLWVCHINADTTEMSQSQPGAAKLS